MKKLPFLFLSVILYSCSPPTPEVLAKEACDCYVKAKNNRNGDNRIEETQACALTVQSKLSRLREIEKDEDMNDEQVKNFENRFDTVYNKCN